MTEVDKTTAAVVAEAKPASAAPLDYDEDIDAWMDHTPTTTESATANNNDRGAYADLRSSTARLGASLRNIATAVDQKLHVSTTVKSIDEATHLSTTVSHGVQKVGSILSNVDQQYQVRETTTNTLKHIDEQYHVRERTVSTAKSVDNKLKLSQAASAVRKFDEENRLTTQTVEALERGASLIEQKVATTVPPTAASTTTTSKNNPSVESIVEEPSDAVNQEGDKK